jgi:hypothetical protein
MSRRSRSHAQTQPTAFFPTQAYLGYPKGYQKEPSLRQRRREYAEFSRKLRAIFAPLLLNHYALHEHMMVQTSLGFSGGAAGADCLAVTRFGVFVITHIRSVGTLRSYCVINQRTVRAVTNTLRRRLARGRLHGYEHVVHSGFSAV